MEHTLQAIYLHCETLSFVVVVPLLVASYRHEKYNIS